MAKQPAQRRGPRAVARPHEHSKERCLDILRQLSAFIDDELAPDICGEIRRHMGTCPHCEDFVASLRQTVALCRHHPAPTLSSAERVRMRALILKTARDR
jgi:anti-sigma factor RsiW